MTLLTLVLSRTPAIVILVVLVLEIIVCRLLTACLAIPVVPSSVVRIMMVALRRLLRKIGTLSTVLSCRLTLK